MLIVCRVLKVLTCQQIFAVTIRCTRKIKNPEDSKEAKRSPQGIAAILLSDWNKISSIVQILVGIWKIIKKTPNRKCHKISPATTNMVGDIDVLF